MKKLLLVFSGLILSSSVLADTPKKGATEITVYKSPTCGCCSKWEEHMKANGFSVTSKPTTEMVAIKSRYHVPSKLRSCHTAKVGDYVIEGHVPADAVKKLLKEHPKNIAGLSVPGMPIGSPGMEGDEPEHYDIVSFDSEGHTKVFDHR